MMGPLRRAIDRFRGAGDAAIALPPLDGAIRPNQALEAAERVLDIKAPDNLAYDGRRVFFSSGAAIMAFDPAPGAVKAETVAAFDSEVTCLATDGSGNLAVGLNDGTVRFAAGPREGQRISDPGARPSCPTALLLDGQTLTIAHGSREHPPLAWKHDLMERNASGSVWRVDLATGKPSCVADRLAFPYGLAAGSDGNLAIAESWRHRIVRAPGSAAGATTALLDHLPGYPARLSPAAGGGYWLCVFAPRSRLVEFVLLERDFCADMFREVEPDYWIAPSLSSGRSFLEPLQGGGIKQLGILKPWAPSRSYGLLIRLDANFHPIASFHSRADGTRHGVTSCVDLGDRVLAACKGGDAIVGVDPALRHGGARK
jgi:sugar lactone lactonase YvrE